MKNISGWYKKSPVEEQTDLEYLEYVKTWPLSNWVDLKSEAIEANEIEDFKELKLLKGKTLTVTFTGQPPKTFSLGAFENNESQKEIVKLFYTGGISFDVNGPPATVSPVVTYLEDHIPGFAEMTQHCPIEGCQIGDPIFLKHTIMHLNDVHRWSREEIANWLEETDHVLNFKQ